MPLKMEEKSLPPIRVVGGAPAVWGPITQEMANSILSWSQKPGTWLRYSSTAVSHLTDPSIRLRGTLSLLHLSVTGWRSVAVAGRPQPSGEEGPGSGSVARVQNPQRRM